MKRYQPVSPGKWYRTELHRGVVQDCPPGHFCTGGFANWTDWTFNPQNANPCFPGSYQNHSNRGSCDPCPEFTSCVMPGMTAPGDCPFGGVCWGGRGFDGNIALCPAGLICVKPYRGPYFRRLLSASSSKENTVIGQFGAEDLSSDISPLPEPLPDLCEVNKSECNSTARPKQRPWPTKFIEPLWDMVKF